MSETNNNNENSFRNIIKGTSIFGSVQVFNILISVVRLKFVATILGPAGMGVAGLFNTASLTLQQIASLGINQAIVKEIGHSRTDTERLGAVLSTIRRLLIATSLLGAFVCLLFPGRLSMWTFGNDSYTSSFILLSAAVFFSIAGGVMMSVLQGLHAVKPLSKASFVGSLVGLIVGVPLYWLLGTSGIVPAMVVLSLSTCTWYFISLRKTLEVEPSPWKQEIHLPILKRMLAMGFILMSNDLFRNLSGYLISIYVRSRGGMDEVGFYQSCNTMTAQYSAIVFTAMAMDYLPRLSATTSDNRAMCKVVNRQMEVVGLLITPIACAVIFLAPWVIELLQTKEFLIATPLLRLMALGVVIRALMYPLGYIVFAKDNPRLFFWMESVGANVLTLFLTLGCYRLWGLYGLGYASIGDCLVCFLVYIIVNRKLYGYRFSNKASGITWIALSVSTAMTLICLKMHGTWMITAGSILLLAISAVSIKSLTRRIKEK